MFCNWGGGGRLASARPLLLPFQCLLSICRDMSKEDTPMMLVHKRLSLLIPTRSDAKEFCNRDGLHDLPEIVYPQALWGQVGLQNNLDLYLDIYIYICTHTGLQTSWNHLQASACLNLKEDHPVSRVELHRKQQPPKWHESSKNWNPRELAARKTGGFPKPGVSHLFSKVTDCVPDFVAIA